MAEVAAVSIQPRSLFYRVRTFLSARLVNIFAGINRCDWIAEGLVQAMRDQEISIPIVVRLAGTNVEKGTPILEASGFPFIMADNLDDAATRVMATLEASA